VDTISEQRDAASIEKAIPGSSASVEELQLPDGTAAEVAVIEPARPRNELDAGYAVGHLESRLLVLEEHIAAMRKRQAAFEEATIKAVEEEAAALELQAAVVEATAEEVLPDDHELALAQNPEHGSRSPNILERLLGGSQKHTPRLP
jgi:hypothetical protein